MLTKGDLKQIDTVVSKRTSKVIQKELKNEITSLGKELKKELDPLKKDVKGLRSDVTKIRKDIDVVISLFDREYVDLRDRVARIEEHLNLPPATS